MPGIVDPTSINNSRQVAGSSTNTCAKNKNINSINLECEKAQDIQFLEVGKQTLVKFKTKGSYWVFSSEKVTVEINPTGIFQLSTTSWDAQPDWILLTNITTNSIGGEATLQFKVDGCPINSIKLTTKVDDDNDVFNEIEIDRFIKEYETMKPFADAHKPAEYSGNYCIMGTSRAFGKLLNNDKDFWVYDDTNNVRLNSLSLETGTYMANDLQKKGFIQSSFTFNEYYSLLKDRLDLQKTNDDSKHSYTMIKLREKRGIYKEYIENEINNKIGFHVFLLSICHEFHVLSILIDNRNPCQSTYAIYDQHGITSSSGNITDIDEGIRRQNSWAFVEYSRHKNYNLFSETEVNLWKIKK